MPRAPAWRDAAWFALWLSTLAKSARQARDFLVITDEAIQKECLEGRQMVWFVDAISETKPFGVASPAHYP